ncbi:hypothetical protein DQ239_13895 [Blastococcus sp. TF02-09]|uniref:hypothetical protein n=1 Tax=Blastococcus sp. TF02-09 TaxID=2250576 RepID=UPI000DE82A39|nr:hypothetical protein [Blastococcus sp. TF02-9]RBY76620.1 hypothetical protein DQ239_13895 [Blastococcus sp. TF02-9]
MDRRERALAALMLFVVLTGVAIVVSGSRPASAQGTAPGVVQLLAYACAIAGGVVLVRASDQRGRRLGGLVLAAAAVMLLVDGLTLLAAEDEGANIGAGLARLVCLLLVGGATVQVALDVAAARRDASQG